MKRALFLVAVVISSAAAFGAEPTHRYVVGVRSVHAHGPFEKEGIDTAGREVTALPYVDAYIADLTDAEATTLRKSPEVTYVDPDMKVHAFSDGPVASVEGHTPDAQTVAYGIDLVHARDVWSVTRGENINVVVIDTGIDYNHVDLKDNYAGGTTFVAGTTDNKDDAGHGTHCAGIIGAADNNIGVVGVAPRTKIWSVKVLDKTGSGSTSVITNGINWVMQKKAELGGNWIINMSLGVAPCSAQVTEDCATTVPTSWQSACQKAADAGILIMAASGNNSAAGNPAPVAYPASFPSVVAIGAVDSKSAIADFSNQGATLALTAPGVDVLSTYPTGQGTNTFVNSNGTFYNADGVVGSSRGNLNNQYVYCGLGASAGDFPSSVKGKIALIQRGTATFNQKTKNALAAGAAGVVIYNCSIAATPSTCTNESTGWTLIGKLADGVTDNPADLTFAWPVTVGISYADGEALRKAAGNPSVNIVNVVDDYTVLSGTSMASPHAAGAAALVWSADPTASAADVLHALTSTARDLGASGQDVVFGYGLIDAFAAAKALAPAKFGSPVSTLPVPGRRITRRGR